MRYYYYICIFHVVYCNTMLSRHLLDFTFRETTYNWSTDLEDVDISPFIQRVGPAVPFSASVWQDTRPVTFISSGHNPAHTKVIHRKKADDSIIDVDCPLPITDYNQFMGGVDRGDQYGKYYHVHVKSRKSYKYIFWFVFEICVLNAFVLHSRHSPYTDSTPTYLSFWKHLAHALI